MAAWREHRKAAKRELKDWTPILVIAILCCIIVAMGFHF